MGFGIVQIILPNGKIKQIDEIFYILQLRKNLIFVSQAKNARYTFIFSPQQCVRMDKKTSNKVLVICKQEGQLNKIG